MAGWSREFPQEDGIYWHYGGRNGRPARLLLLRIMDGMANNLRSGSFMAYVEDLPGWWQPLEKPELPKE